MYYLGETKELLIYDHINKKILTSKPELNKDQLEHIVEVYNLLI